MQAPDALGSPGEAWHSLLLRMRGETDTESENAFLVVKDVCAMLNRAFLRGSTCMVSKATKFLYLWFSYYQLAYNHVHRLTRSGVAWYLQLACAFMTGVDTLAVLCKVCTPSTKPPIFVITVCSLWYMARCLKTKSRRLYGMLGLVRFVTVPWCVA